MKCPHCGGEHPNESLFCPVNGKRIEPQPVQKKIVYVQKTKASTHIVYILIILALIIALVGSIVYLLNEESSYKWQITNLEERNNELCCCFESCPIVVTDISMGNIDYEGNIETDYGEYIESETTMFLQPKITYVGGESQEITLQYKLYDSWGELREGEVAGFTISDEKKVYRGEHTLYLRGWGGKVKGHWCSGKYKIEIWYKNRIISGRFFTVH